MFSNIGEEALAATESEFARTAFIQKNENFILGVASKFSKHFISKSDDEWSIALIAFSNAMDTYDMSKGNFQSYARLLIERRLTDYFRTQARYQNEIHTEPYVFEGNVDEDSEHAAFQTNVIRTASTTDENPLRDEILSLNELLKQFDITFMDLTSCSPKAGKTKRACFEAILYMKENPHLVANMEVNGQIPSKIITENTSVPRKILERHRKYIITAVEILCNDFPLLSEYIKV